MKIKLNCQHAGTCLADYWSGHHLPHVQIPVYRGMTPKAVRDALRDELQQGAVMGSDDDARLLSADCVRPGEEKRADALTRAAYAAINRDVKPRVKGTRRLFLGLEPADSDDGEVYAFFVFADANA